MPLYKRHELFTQGSERSKFKDGCVLFNAANSEQTKFYRNDAERLFRYLTLRNVLEEELVIGAHENVIGYLKLGAKAMDVNHGRMKASVYCWTRLHLVVSLFCLS